MPKGYVIGHKRKGEYSFKVNWFSTKLNAEKAKKSYTKLGYETFIKKA